MNGTWMTAVDAAKALGVKHKTSVYRLKRRKVNGKLEFFVKTNGAAEEPETKPAAQMFEVRVCLDENAMRRLATIGLHKLMMGE